MARPSTVRLLGLFGSSRLAVLLTPLTRALPPALAHHLRTLVRLRRRNGFWHLNTPDRVVLEGEIIPHFARTLPQGARVLDIGLDWYTEGYRAMFRRQRYATLDIDESKKRYSGSHHICDSALALSEYFDPATLDLIICNGVMGWGVNDPASNEALVREMVNALKPDGFLVFGFNDVPEHRPDRLPDEISSVLQGWDLPSRGCSEIRTESANEHVFRLYRRR